MPFDAPFRLGPFTVDEAGRLLPASEGRFPAFTLRWRDRPIEVSMERLADGIGWLTLTIRVGLVASTADAAPGISQPKRERAFAILRALVAELPEGWRLELAADHGVRLLARQAFDMPASVNALLTQVTTALLVCAPYLDVLAEEGVAPGRLNTCPG